MTKNELEFLHLKVKIGAMHVLMRTLYAALVNSSATSAQVCRDELARLRQDHGKIALAGTTPQESELVTTAYREALDELLTFIESGLRR
jgi:hypothetical protein